MKDPVVKVGYETRLEGAVDGNVHVIEDTFVTVEGVREQRLTKVTIQRADIDDLVLGMFEFLPPDRARELVQKISRRRIKP